MFDCSFVLRLKTKDANVTLCREAKLPFAPSVGQWINFDGDLEYIEAGTVEYSIPDGSFDVSERRNHGDDCSCKKGDGCCTFNELHWIESGWEVMSVCRGADIGVLEPWQFPVE